MMILVLAAEQSRSTLMPTTIKIVLFVTVIGALEHMLAVAVAEDERDNEGEGEKG